MRIPKAVAAAALALLAGQGRADTVDVTSTTLLRLGQETRGKTNPLDPELETVAPVFEILSITARQVTNPLVDDLSIVVSTWGSYEPAEPRWDVGTTSELTGDVVTGYLQGRLAGRRLTLRLGRAHVVSGVARMIHLDGGEAIATLPLGVRLSAYGGVPVTQRFASRTAIRSWNPTGGDLAYGGRVGWSLAVPGAPGRGLDVGASVNFVEDGGDPVREEAGADLRLVPVAGVTVTGFGAYSLYDERFSEITGRLTWAATRKLSVEADARYFASDLLLARNSILSVFAAEEQKAFGAGASYAIGKGLRVGGAYHLQLEPPEVEGGSDELGHEAELRVDWERGHTLAGGEILFLDALENGYVAVRVFGRQEYGRLFAVADVFGHLFREAVNEEDAAVTGTLTAGVDLAKGFSAVVSGRAGMTPFLEQTFDVMAKLVYNSTYRIREVR